jgi:hypothetical protein
LVFHSAKEGAKERVGSSPLSKPNQMNKNSNNKGKWLKGEMGMSFFFFTTTTTTTTTTELS